MDIHLVPPQHHRVNTAKRTIATFNEHFISALTTVDRNCPLQLWDDFLPQVELTVSLLRFSQWDPICQQRSQKQIRLQQNTISTIGYQRTSLR